MNEKLQFGTEEAIKIQNFAEQTLEEIARRANEDGMEQIGLHSAICVCAGGWLKNNVGPDRTVEMLKQLSIIIKEENKDK